MINIDFMDAGSWSINRQVGLCWLGISSDSECVSLTHQAAVTCPEWITISHEQHKLHTMLRPKISCKAVLCPCIQWSPQRRITCSQHQHAADESNAQFSLSVPKIGAATTYGSVQIQILNLATKHLSHRALKSSLSSLGFWSLSAWMHKRLQYRIQAPEHVEIWRD